LADGNVQEAVALLATVLLGLPGSADKEAAAKGYVKGIKALHLHISGLAATADPVLGGLRSGDTLFEVAAVVTLEVVLALPEGLAKELGADFAMPTSIEASRTDWASEVLLFVEGMLTAKRRCAALRLGVLGRAWDVNSWVVAWRAALGISRPPLQFQRAARFSPRAGVAVAGTVQFLIASGRTPDGRQVQFHKVLDYTTETIIRAGFRTSAELVRLSSSQWSQVFGEQLPSRFHGILQSKLVAS
jgi:hypothetical protein